MLSTAVKITAGKDSINTIKKENIYQIRSCSRPSVAAEYNYSEIWQQIELRPGMWISMLESSSKDNIKLEYQKDPAMIDFGFVLSGRINHTFFNNGNSMEAACGFAGIGYFPGKKGIAELSGRHTLRAFHLHIAPETLYNMIKDDLGTMPSDFRHIIEGSTRKTFLSRRSMDPITSLAVSEFFNPKSTGFPRKLFLEYKAMEILNLQITYLMSHENSSGLCASERSRIIEAHDMLLKDLSAPPTLKALSQNFSLSHNKLQYGFRIMFGNSVFGYLREYKMQKACSLFKTTDMNVSQVAGETGYVNVSKFSRAFKKRFGVLPKQYLNSIV